MDRRSKLLWAVAGVGALVTIAFAIGIATNIGEHANHQHDMKPKEPVTTMSAVVQPGPPRVSFPLPTKAVDVRALLGQRREVVDRALGKPEAHDDDSLGYEVGADDPKTSLSVEANFETTGELAHVQFIGHKRIDTAEERDDVLRWANLRNGQDDLDWQDSSSVGVFTPGARARYEHRRDVAKDFTKVMKGFGYDGWATVTPDGTRLTLSLAAGDRTCTRATLRQLYVGLKPTIDLKSEGFGSIECDVDGDVLKL